MANKSRPLPFNQRQLIIVIGVIIVGVIGIFAVVLLTNNPADSIAEAAETSSSFYDGLERRLTTDGTPLLGDPEAPVTIVEFADFSCPHCATYRDVIHQVVDEYVRDGLVRIEFRILAGLDPVGSPIAARAAFCAGEQDAFWEMHDQLFTLRETYSAGAFNYNRIREAAEALDLNANALDSCVRSTSRFNDTLQSTRDLASSLEVASTPSILLRIGNSRPQWIEINGERYPNVPFDTLDNLLQSALEETQS